jgi:hypothetical protein
MTCFEAADRLFTNATTFSVHREQLAAPGALREISRTVGRMFGAVAGQEDEATLRILRRSLATLRFTINGALMPLASPVLSLREQSDRIGKLAEAYGHDLVALAERLRSAVEGAMEIDSPPKRTTLEEMFRSTRGRIGVVYPARSVPGWDDTLVRHLERLADFATIIPVVSRKALVNAHFDLILSVWPLARTGLAEELLFAYRTRDLRLILYRHENASIPEAASLPSIGVSSKPRRPSNPAMSGIAHDEELEPEIDDWVDVTYVSGGARVLGEVDRQHLVAARFVRLATGQIVALREERRVIEVSSLLDVGAAPATTRLPRSLVRELTRGDLIVLRTSGSGDYLDDVATQLIARDARAAEIDAALLWKGSLERALVQHGASFVAGLLRDRCPAFTSHDNYLWAWTTLDVIKPATPDTFSALLDVLVKVKAIDPIDAAGREHLWRMMKLLVRYHVAAGQEIRRVLLARLRELIAAQTLVTTALQLELPGVNAGQLSVLRVESVASTPSLVPYTEIGILRTEAT